MGLKDRELARRPTTTIHPACAGFLARPLIASQPALSCEPNVRGNYVTSMLRGKGNLKDLPLVCKKNTVCFKKGCNSPAELAKVSPSAHHHFGVLEGFMMRFNYEGNSSNLSCNARTVFPVPIIERQRPSLENKNYNSGIVHNFATIFPSPSDSAHHQSVVPHWPNCWPCCLIAVFRHGTGQAGTSSHLALPHPQSVATSQPTHSRSLQNRLERQLPASQKAA